MGKHFGELAKISGIVTFRLSPHEQKAFAGMISHGIPNMFRRFSENVFRVTPPFIVSYLWYDWAKKDHEKQTRKNPKNYENDV
ncbi:cytochrome b-c1 complex subunit 8 [Cephus cinctus]|uniref:Cytochrome b-c1 complex subunit 8 n=1 Tax=Cephus cinctus TaxID=211228 RepID=A0AAJ7C1F2_CEPCN|nr:cytochrome b-c1 complex subunit 8 [Cephus cinctus]